MKRFPIALLVVFAAALSFGVRAARAQDAAFYVAPAGDDANPGTLTKPFATLERARGAVRELVKAGLKRDVTVVIRGGTYYLPNGIAFGLEDSGTAQHRITWRAQSNEVPVLIGGRRVTGWRQHRGQVWVADMQQAAKASQLFEDGKRLTLARTPNEGYFKLEKPVAGKTKEAFVYRAQDLEPRDWELRDASVFMWPGHDWFSVDKPLVALDAGTRTIVMEGRGGYDMKAGNRYFIKNVLAFLDRPGECQLSPSAGKAYMWPRKTLGPLQNYVASTAPSLLFVKGSEQQTVRNLHFEGLDLSIAEGDIVQMEGVEDCSIRFCKIENAKGTGVLIRDSARRVTLYGNLIREHGHLGVHLSGRGAGQADVNRDHVIENNHIHHCGRLVGHGYGVRISQSGHNRIVHNHIHHMPRYATTIKGPRYGTIEGKIKGLTFENRHDFLHSRQNLIAYNDIHHCNTDSQDTGALESWGPGRDNVYDHNLVHDCGNGEFNLQSGMYLDDATDYFTITNNIIYGITGTSTNQPIYAKGIGNKIVNNILICDPPCGTGIQSFFMADERCDRHEYVRNIIYFQGAPAAAQGRFGQGVSNLHDKGKTLEWDVEIPADGAYAVWLRYASFNKPYNNPDMGGRTQMSVDGAAPVALENLPDTGDWGRQEWSRAGALELKQGKRRIVWTNVKGGGLNWDAFALCSDPAWKPEGVTLATPAAGKQLVVVQTETHLANQKDNTRPVYGFQNWSDDRVTQSDDNIFWATHGKIAVKGGPANGDWEKWRALQGGKYDAHSLIADPLFVDPARRDYRLRPESPALKLGFEPIDTSEIGLKADFPKRFERE